MVAVKLDEDMTCMPLFLLARFVLLSCGDKFYYLSRFRVWFSTCLGKINQGRSWVLSPDKGRWRSLVVFHQKQVGVECRLRTGLWNQHLYIPIASQGKIRTIHLNCEQFLNCFMEWKRMVSCILIYESCIIHCINSSHVTILGPAICETVYFKNY